MSVRISQIAWLGLVASGMAGAVDAQVARQPDPNTPRMMVLTFRSNAPGNSGVQAADALRSRLGSDIPYKQLWQIPNTEINAVLEASGYRKDEPLSSNDARELGRQLRADEFVQGTVRKDGESWKIEATLHLVRAAAVVGRDIRQARRRRKGARGRTGRGAQAARPREELRQRCS